MKRVVWISIPLLLILSCTASKPDLGMAGTYFPEIPRLREGIVNKYYYHFDPGEDRNPSTTPQYRLFKLVGENEVRVTVFNPAFEPTQVSLYRFEQDEIHLLEEKLHYRWDSLEVEVLQPIQSAWAQDSNTFVYRIPNTNGMVQEVKQQQLSMRDTVMFSQRLAKAVKREQIVTVNQADGEIQDYHSSSELTYVEGIGLYSVHVKQKSGEGRLELIEQIPMDEFEQMTQHGVKRVAYINPDKAIDREGTFQLCESEARIVDYYNGVENASGMLGGKRALWDILEDHLDAEQLEQESGYLTFRFVINCEGEAGWFVTEEADLAYQRKTFSHSCVNHLHQLLTSYPSWKVCRIDDQPRDSYMYITFILKDGQVAELLP